MSKVQKVKQAELLARSGVNLEDVVMFADEIQEAGSGIFVWSMGITQHFMEANVAAICSLAAGLSVGPVAV